LQEYADRSTVSDLPNPVLYPVKKRESYDSATTGLPDFDLIMRVDIQGKFGKEMSVMAFQNNFGSLPPRAIFEVTEMLFKKSSGKKKGSLPRDIFLPDPRIVPDFTRHVVLCFFNVSMHTHNMDTCSYYQWKF
jgi:hypothetical protein